MTLFTCGRLDKGSFSRLGCKQDIWPLLNG